MNIKNLKFTCLENGYGSSYFVSLLLLALALFPLSGYTHEVCVNPCPAAPSKDAESDVSIRDIGVIISALVAILVFFWTQFWVPYNERKRSKKDFIAYIKANSEQVLSEFNPNASVSAETFQKYINSHQLLEPKWLSQFLATDKDSRKGIPEIVAVFYLGLQISKSQQAIDEEYYPVPIYSGSTETDNFDHSHPVWSLDSTINKPVYDFLVTQKNVVDAIGSMYSGKAKSLIESKSMDDRLRWFLYASGVLDSLVEHYFATEKVRRKIKSTDCAIHHNSELEEQNKLVTLLREWQQLLGLLDDHGLLLTLKKALGEKIGMRASSIEAELLGDLKRVLALYRCTSISEIDSYIKVNEIPKISREIDSNDIETLKYQPPLYLKLQLDVMWLQLLDLEVQFTTSKKDKLSS